MLLFVIFRILSVSIVNMMYFGFILRAMKIRKCLYEKCMHLQDGRECKIDVRTYKNYLEQAVY